MLRDAYCAESSYTSKMKLTLSQVLEGSLLCDLHLSHSFFSLVPVSKWFLFFRLLLLAPADKGGMEYCSVCDSRSLCLVPSDIKRCFMLFCFPH